MPSHFFEQPILNSPYAYPGRHWELDPTVSRPTKLPSRAAGPLFDHPRTRAEEAPAGLFKDKEGISTAQQQYDLNTIINEIRGYVDQ